MDIDEKNSRSDPEKASTNSGDAMHNLDKESPDVQVHTSEFVAVNGVKRDLKQRHIQM